MQRLENYFYEKDREGNVKNKIYLVWDFMGQHYKKVHFNYILNKYDFFYLLSVYK